MNESFRQEKAALPDAAENADAAPVSGKTAALIELALAVGGFGIGTGEFAIMGLLPDVAASYGVSVPEAGHVISAYALGVVVGAPIIAVLSARLPRKTLLIGLMSLFALGNLASAFAPGFLSFTLLRFITGLPHGAYFGVASLVAASMAAPNRRASAVGRVMLGLTVATLLGTPLATFFGQMLSWRSAFVLVGTIAALTALLIGLNLARDKVEESASIRRELGAFTRPQVWFNLAIAATGFGGLFAIFSYIARTTTDTAGLPASTVALVLVVFGIGMNVGNILGSRLADYSLKGTIGGMQVFNMVVMTTFSLTAANPVMLFICVFLTGCGFAACPAVQTRLMDVAADAQTLAAASNHSAFNIANALGAWLGGLAVAHYGYGSTGYVGAALSVLGFCVFMISLLAERRSITVNKA
ncbi:MFS transporter [Allorhizobium undicola]|uniref:MFS transporter n=1 Tax=Allorhizobium undicola TaxID=78527 RepID=UPI000559C3E9|nr:MFS transporter [Allorhizobium undicola]